LNQAKRMPSEFDLSARVVSINGNGAGNGKETSASTSVM
jgi:hypothetical protein